jgi:hypothetical protein
MTAPRDRPHAVECHLMESNWAVHFIDTDGQTRIGPWLLCDSHDDVSSTVQDSIRIRFLPLRMNLHLKILGVLMPTEVVRIESVDRLGGDGVLVNLSDGTQALITLGQIVTLFPNREPSETED